MPAIVKQRFPKIYRHPVLDMKLTRSRLTSEVRAMMRARKVGVLTPVPFHVDQVAYTIAMERVAGASVKDIIHKKLMDSAALADVMAQIGRAVAALHDGGLVHGDLTTSNLMVRDADQRLVVIDFGLSYNSMNPEDKGVDLYVLERAFLSAHSRSPGLFDLVLEAYKDSSKMWNSTLNRFAEVRLRGRKRSMIG